MENVSETNDDVDTQTVLQFLEDVVKMRVIQPPSEAPNV